MANTKISALPTYTGDTTGAYLVMDNSGLTQTYKVRKETLIGSSGTSGTSGTSGVSVGQNAYTSAGTIQSVGWGATTTNPTISSFGVAWNEIAYQQLGTKLWQVVMSYSGNGTGNSDGSGDYLFTLPNNLSFDTTISWQIPYSGAVQSSDTTFGKHVIPSGSGMISDGAGSVTTNFTPVVWDSRKFRILAHMPGTAIKCIGSNWFEASAPIGFTLTFQFVST
jgi:hypothetical protein